MTSIMIIYSLVSTLGIQCLLQNFPELSLSKLIMIRLNHTLPLCSCLWLGFLSNSRPVDWNWVKSH